MSKRGVLPLMLQILNLRHLPVGVVYIRVDRQTKWGNPFIMLNQTEGERLRVCALFLDYAERRHEAEPEWLTPLRGNHLACWCAPKLCHAETLLRLANRSTPLKEITHELMR